MSDSLSKWLLGAVGAKFSGASSKNAPAAKPSQGPKRSRGGNRGFRGRPESKSAPVKAHKPHPGRPPLEVKPGVMRVIPVGGLEEVGKNCMIVEYEKDIVVVDMGFQFPEDEMFGVDYVIPDIQYLVHRRQRIRAILITHAHLDHVGALPYVLEDLGFPPIYGTKLSIGLIQRILEEHNMLKKCTFKEVNPKEPYQFGRISVDFFRVNHSIPDSVGMAIATPAGRIVHTGDFKFDFTPADGVPSDIAKMEKIGKMGVDILFSDSTNATRPGHTLSEKMIGENLKKSMQGVKGRVIVACFASLIGRIQQILEFALAENRKVFFSGGSMIRNMEMAQKLGFLKAPKGLIKDIRFVTDFPDDQVLILTTGSQGEPMAALSRMATNTHAQVQIRAGDKILLSSSPILGNEKSVSFLIDQLSRLGAEIVHSRIMDVHTSGHGHQEDLKMMMTFIKPNHLVPIHGTFYMRKAHGELGPMVGIEDAHVHMMDNGNVIEIRNRAVSFEHEDIGVKFVVIDGRGRGDLGSMVQKEREMMSKNGALNVVLKMSKGRLSGKPLILMQGFLYHEESPEIYKDLEKKIYEVVSKLAKHESKASYSALENQIKSALSGLILRVLDRRPLINVKVLKA